MLTLDGSRGEGGGQILRTSLSLAACTNTPFHLENIRARRAKPGLMRQHLTAVEAAAEVCQAEVRGATLGSRELWFEPKKVEARDYHFRIGSAGSTTLVLQTVLPPLLLAAAPSTITIEGGTHNIHAPPFDFLARSFLPLINRMGPHVALTLERYGFYPAGGGRITGMIEPVSELQPLHIEQRGPITHRAATAIVSALPEHIGRRELAVVANELAWPEELMKLEHLPSGHGPGNVLLIEVSDGEITEVVTGFGERGVRAETVASRAAAEMQAYLRSDAPVGHYLADQLLLPFALAGGGSFVAAELSQHAITNIDTIAMFLPVTITVSEVGAGRVRVEVRRGETLAPAD